MVKIGNLCQCLRFVKQARQIAQNQRLFNIFVIILVILGVFHPREQARSPGLRQQG